MPQPQPPFPQPPQHANRRIIQIMELSFPQPQPPPLNPPPLPQQHSKRRIIQIHELFPPSHPPHPQFVAAKSLIGNLQLFSTVYHMLYGLY